VLHYAGIRTTAPVEGLVQDQQLDPSFRAGQPQIRVHRLHRAQPEPHLPPHLVADHDADLCG
jgi:hypothetical protein